MAVDSTYAGADVDEHTYTYKYTGESTCCHINKRKRVHIRIERVAI